MKYKAAKIDLKNIGKELIMQPEATENVASNNVCKAQQIIA